MPPSEHLPAYQWENSSAALRALCGRMSAVHALSAQCTLTLTRSNGESVRLDGAIVMRPPDSVRMRAWKFSQAVFDLTLTPDGLWIEAPRDQKGREKVMPASLSAAKMARAWSVMSGEFFCDAGARVEDHGGPSICVERMMQGQRIVCEVERATLTPRRYFVIDRDGVERFALSLERYELIGGIAWPVRLSARSEKGRIGIELKEVELNGELAPNAFVPPRRAEKVL